MSGITLGIIGCGTMGIAVLSGVIDSQRAHLKQLQLNGGSGAAGETSMQSSIGEEDLRAQLPSKFIACVNRQESAKRLRKLLDKEGYTEVKVLQRNNLECAREADVVLLACKPHTVKEVLAEQGIKEALDGKLVCSICAGLRIEQIRAWVTEGTKVVRAMPNTPSKVSLIKYR